MGDILLDAVSTIPGLFILTLGALAGSLITREWFARELRIAKASQLFAEKQLTAAQQPLVVTESEQETKVDALAVQLQETAQRVEDLERAKVATEVERDEARKAAEQLRIDLARAEGELELIRAGGTAPGQIKLLAKSFHAQLEEVVDIELRAHADARPVQRIELGFGGVVAASQTFSPPLTREAGSAFVRMRINTGQKGINGEYLFSPGMYTLFAAMYDIHGGIVARDDGAIRIIFPPVPPPPDSIRFAA